MTRRPLYVASILAVMTTAVEAHTGIGAISGFGQGFAHPLGGLDHILAMVAVGLFAINLGGRAMWLVPAAFVAMMAVSGMLGIGGVAVPFVEIGIALSVIVLGLAVALQWSIPISAAMVLVGFFAIFHGHAHGAEMPVSGAGLPYAIGFVSATALLHAIGLGFGFVAGAKVKSYFHRVAQIGGGAMALAGVGILTGVL